jgi:hypothetical protein
MAAAAIPHAERGFKIGAAALFPVGCASSRSWHSIFRDGMWRQ